MAGVVNNVPLITLVRRDACCGSGEINSRDCALEGGLSVNVNVLRDIKPKCTKELFFPHMCEKLVFGDLPKMLLSHEKLRLKFEENKIITIPTNMNPRGPS